MSHAEIYDSLKPKGSLACYFVNRSKPESAVVLESSLFLEIARKSVRRELRMSVAGATQSNHGEHEDTQRLRGWLCFVHQCLTSILHSLKK